MAIGVGKAFISHVVLHGWLSLKYSAYKRLYVWKSRFMLTKNTVTSTRFSHFEPDSSKITRTLSKTERHCASKSNSIKFPFLSNFKPGTPESVSSEPAVQGPTPERNNKFPTFRACGYKPTGLGAFCVEIREFSSILPIFVQIYG